MKTPIYSTIFTESEKSEANNFYRYGNNLRDEFDKYLSQLYPFLGASEQNLIANFKAINEFEEKNEFFDIAVEEFLAKMDETVISNLNFSLRDNPEDFKAINESVLDLIKTSFDTFQKNKQAAEHIVIIKEFNEKLDPFKADLANSFATLELNVDIDRDSQQVKDLLGQVAVLLSKCQKVGQKIKSLELSFVVSSDLLVGVLEGFQKESITLDDIVYQVSQLEARFENYFANLEQIGNFDPTESGPEHVG